jgi:hypothetical protein
MKKEQDGKRVVLDDLPAVPQFNFVPDSCIRQKENLRMPLHSQMEIDIFHCRKRVSVIEPIDLLE